MKQTRSYKMILCVVSGCTGEMGMKATNCLSHEGQDRPGCKLQQQLTNGESMRMGRLCCMFLLRQTAKESSSLHFLKQFLPVKLNKKIKLGINFFLEVIFLFNSHNFI